MAKKHAKFRQKNRELEDSKMGQYGDAGVSADSEESPKRVQQRQKKDPTVSEESWIRFRLLEKQAELAAVDYELGCNSSTRTPRTTRPREGPGASRAETARDEKRPPSLDESGAASSALDECAALLGSAPGVHGGAGGEATALFPQERTRGAGGNRGEALGSLHGAGRPGDPAARLGPAGAAGPVSPTLARMQEQLEHFGKVMSSALRCNNY